MDVCLWFGLDGRFPVEPAAMWSDPGDLALSRQVDEILVDSGRPTARTGTLILDAGRRVSGSHPAVVGVFRVFRPGSAHGVLEKERTGVREHRRPMGCHRNFSRWRV